MALYRHNSTGFLGEFASNPGAGYTAISAMPTDTVANRVAWWRALDTFGQTSSWHPSLYRLPQDPGEATISIQFSQDIALISSEPDGTVTNPRDPTNSWYIGATTEVRVYRGITDVTITEGWTLTKVEEGCTSTLSEAGGLYTLKLTSIPLLATNAGYVRITATRTGSGTFTKDFRFLKVFQGQDGAAGTYVSYVFKASATTPPTPTDTTPIPAGWLDSPPVSSDPVWMSKATVSGELAGTWSTPVKVTAIDGSDGSFTTYQYAKNTSFTTAPTTGWADTPYALSAGEYQWMRTKTTDPNTGDVSYGAAYRVTGEKGEDGANGSSGTVIDLSNEAHTVPTDADGYNGVYTGATTTASLFIGSTEDSANWTWTATPSGGVTGTATNSNRTYTVSAMSVDVGTVTFTANKTGEAQRTAVFTISKAKGGVAYSLDVSAGSISKSKAGAYNPASLTLTASKITTSGVTTYAGRIRIQTQATLGGVWTTVYTSPSDETTTTYSVPANIVAIKAMLYLAGGFTSLLDQESVPVVFDGQDGSSGIILDLDNENQTVAAAKDGTWISGTTATTTARLYLGATQLTSGITWSVQSATAGITYSQTNNTSSYTVSVTGMTAALATGTITVAAVYNGVTYTQVFTISKANAGADGTPATVYWLSTSASAIAKDAAGTYNPTSFTANAYSQTGTNAPAAYTGRFQIQTQATLNGGWTTTYSSAGNESSTTYSVPANIVAIRVYLYQAGGTSVLLDQETLPVVADGQPGTQGDRGSRQIVITGTANWSDTAAWDGIISRFGGTKPVLSDLVTIVNTSAGTSTSKFCTANGTRPGTWETVTEYINGNLLVTGTVGANAIAANAITSSKIAAGSITADRIDSRGLSIKDSAGNVILAAGTPLSSGNVTPAAGWLNSNVTITNGAIQGIGTGAGTAVANSLLTDSIAAAATTANWATITNVPTFGGFAYLSSITSANISTYIAGAAIGTAYIADAAITSAKIASLSADKLTAGTINGSNITVTNLNATNITTGTLNGARVGTGVSGDVLTTGTLNAALCNVTNLNAANITTGNISASRIGAGTIDAAVINLNTANAVIKTSNFTLGTGFRISGDGTAFFYGASVTGSSRSANWNGTVNAGTGQPTAGTGTQGWCIDSAGNAEFNTVIVRSAGNVTDGAITSSGGYGSPSTGINTVVGTSEATFWAPSQSATTVRGTLCFNASLALRSNTGQAITGYITIYRNGSPVRSNFFYFPPISGGVVNAVVPVTYVDTARTTSAITYSFRIASAGSGTSFTVKDMDQWWIELKR